VDIVWARITYEQGAIMAQHLMYIPYAVILWAYADYFAACIPKLRVVFNNFVWVSPSYITIPIMP